MRERSVILRNAFVARDVPDELLGENTDLLCNVEVLEFTELNKITTPAVCMLLSQTTQLVQLSTSYHAGDETDMLLDTLTTLTHLKKLDVSGSCKINTIAVIQRLRNLTELKLPDNIDFSIVDFASCAALESISIGGHGISEHVVDLLCMHCPRLHSLSIECFIVAVNFDPLMAVLVRYRKNMKVLNLPQDFQNCMNITDATMVQLAALSANLECISVSSSLITDRTINALAAHCPRLTQITLFSCPQVTAEAMANLVGHCSNLETLNLSNSTCANDDVIYRAIQSCPFLSELVILRAGVTDASVIALASKFPRLRRLNISRCFRLTDDSVVAVCFHCRHLQELFLDDLNITDASIEAMVLYLRKLTAWGADCEDVSLDVRRRLQQANPGALWM